LTAFKAFDRNTRTGFLTFDTTATGFTSAGAGTTTNALASALQVDSYGHWIRPPGAYKRDNCLAQGPYL